MKLNLLKNKRTKSAKRLGRGSSSGKGRASGRGHKGQKSRSGFNIPKRFEGGQMPLVQRLPKKGGFKSLQIKPAVFNLDTLDKYFIVGEIVSPKTLAEKKLIKSAKIHIKILGRGKLTKNLQFKGCMLSDSVKKILKTSNKVKS